MFLSNKEACSWKQKIKGTASLDECLMRNIFINFIFFIAVVSNIDNHRKLLPDEETGGLHQPNHFVVVLEIYHADWSDKVCDFYFTFKPATQYQTPHCVCCIYSGIWPTLFISSSRVL